MYKGIYIALSGAVVKQNQLEIVSRNLANSKTISYKKDMISFKDYLMKDEFGLHQATDGRAMTEIADIATDYTDGEAIRTGNPFDIALQGRGFMSLDDGSFTRRGDLKMDNDGYLVTYKGVKVLGNGGHPIRMPKVMGDVVIESNGAISVGGNKVDKLNIVDFEGKQALMKAGSEFFLIDEDTPRVESSARVSQGYLEASNVNIIREMIELIRLSREFEAYQKIMRSFDETMSRATNEMPR